MDRTLGFIYRVIRLLRKPPQNLRTSFLVHLGGRRAGGWGGMARPCRSKLGGPSGGAGAVRHAHHGEARPGDLLLLVQRILQQRLEPARDVAVQVHDAAAGAGAHHRAPVLPLCLVRLPTPQAGPREGTSVGVVLDEARHACHRHSYSFAAYHGI